jgi:lysozyme
MKVSDCCLKLIRECEGFVSKPYLCPAGIPTIGYGSTRYADGTQVKLTDPPISTDQADAIMRATLVEYESAVNRYVTVPIDQNQFDALVDFAYNCGAKNLLMSTLLKKVNAVDFSGAALEFGKWVYANGKPLPGLVKRRYLEMQLFQGELS